MCGRYYVADETAKEIEKLVRQADEKLHKNTAEALKRISSTDIHPSDIAPVLLAADGHLACTWLHWGFPMQQNQGKGLVFNARCESAAEKPFFREGIRHLGVHTNRARKDALGRQINFFDEIDYEKGAFPPAALLPYLYHKLQFFANIIIDCFHKLIAFSAFRND